MPIVQPARTTVPLAAPSAVEPAQVVFERAGELWALSLPSQEMGVLAGGLQSASSLGQGEPWALAPDGRWLAFAGNAEDGAMLALADLAGQMHDIGHFSGRIDALHWSHDSTRVAFVVNRRDEQTGDLLEASVRVFDTVAGRETVLYQEVYHPSDSYREEIWLEGWVPGDRALYVALAMDRTGDPGLLYVLDLRGGELRLVSESYLLKGGQAVSPATSHVLLRSRSAGGRAAPLYLAQAGPDGMLEDVRPLSPEEWTVGAVAWSPDGRQVVVERLEAELHGTYSAHLWLLSPGGEPALQLTGDSTFREEGPIWAPGGEALVFGRWLALRPQPAGLWILHLPDGEAELLDEAGARPQAAVGEGR